MRMPPLPADFIHSRVCKPICEKYLTLPLTILGISDINAISVAATVFALIQVIDFYITKASIVKGIIRKWKNRIEEHIFDNKLRTAAMYNSIIKRIEDEKALNTIDNNVNM